MMWSQYIYHSMEVCTEIWMLKVYQLIIRLCNLTACEEFSLFLPPTNETEEGSILESAGGQLVC